MIISLKSSSVIFDPKALASDCKGDWSKAPGDSSVNYNLWNIVTTYLQEIPQRIR